MRLAQQLYEGVDIKGRGTIGLITYLRTDSTRIAAEADAAARSYIGDQFGASYVSEAPAAKIRRQDPGRTRGDPSDRHYTDAGTGKRTAFQRPVPSVPAYLEALHGESDAPGGLRRQPPSR